MADFLAQMAEASRARAAGLDEAALALAATRAPLPPAPDLGGFILFAEVKRSSPSEGHLAEVDPVQQALAYARGGACAVSVLTEPSRFGGSLDDLRAVAEALRPLGVPAMRKDFLVDRRQVLEARAAGAGGVLLIAAILDDARLRELGELALGLGMFVLLEAFDQAEVERLDALAGTWTDHRHGRFGHVFVGLNCRDLRSLQVDPARFATVPRPRMAFPIAESGIQTPADAARVRALGWSGALVGTALMRSGDPEAAVRAMKSCEKSSGAMFVKLCGLRTVDDVHAAVLAGADMVGFVVVDSPRRVSLDDLPDLCAAVPDGMRAIAVMRDFDPTLYVAVAPHVQGVQCRAETVPAELPPLPPGVQRPQLLLVVRDGPDLPARAAAQRNHALVIDAAEEGSGQLADPDRVRAALAAHPFAWLAGGLTPDNVAARVRDSGALNVDVSSGIESAPGVKDPALMRDFVIAAKTAHLSPDLPDSDRS